MDYTAYEILQVRILEWVAISISMINLDSVLKSNRDITLPAYVHIVKAMVFPVVMCGCENWTIKNAAPFSSVTQSCPTLCDPMDYSTPGFPVLHYSWSLLTFMSIESVMPSSHLILCRPLLLLPSIFPSIRVFSNESVLCIRWSKYWRFSISPSNLCERQRI